MMWFVSDLFFKTSTKWRTPCLVYFAQIDLIFQTLFQFYKSTHATTHTKQERNTNTKGNKKVHIILILTSY